MQLWNWNLTALKLHPRYWIWWTTRKHFRKRNICAKEYNSVIGEHRNERTEKQRSKESASMNEPNKNSGPRIGASDGCYCCYRYSDQRRPITRSNISCWTTKLRIKVHTRNHSSQILIAFIWSMPLNFKFEDNIIYKSVIPVAISFRKACAEIPHSTDI